jgi:hypothetical protein
MEQTLPSTLTRQSASKGSIMRFGLFLDMAKRSFTMEQSPVIESQETHGVEGGVEMALWKNALLSAEGGQENSEEKNESSPLLSAEADKNSFEGANYIECLNL